MTVEQRPEIRPYFLLLFRKKRCQILSSKKLSLSSRKPASRTAAIKLLEGNGRSSFRSTVRPRRMLRRYIYISGTRCPSKLRRYASNNQPEAIPPLTNDASNSTVTGVQRARYWRTWPQCEWLISSNGQRNEARVGETSPTTDSRYSASHLDRPPLSLMTSHCVSKLAYIRRAWGERGGGGQTSILSKAAMAILSRFAHPTRPNLTSAFRFSLSLLGGGRKFREWSLFRVYRSEIVNR